MKAVQSKRKPAGKGREIVLELKPSEHIFAILSDFQNRHMSKQANAATAAYVLLTTALMDYGNLFARVEQVERYCNAEGFKDQGEYRESVLRTKFPRGRVPRQKMTR